MASDNHGDKTQEEPQAQEDHGQQQAAQEQPQVSGTDWEKAVVERDEKIAVLEAQVVEAAKNTETAEQLRGEIAELKAQGEYDRIDFKLQLAGVRIVKAARAMLGDYDGDVDALKGAEPWLFANERTSKPPGGKTGLSNAGTSSDEDKTMKRWRRLAGLDDSNDNA
jgi:hypothetical protein